MGKMKHGEHTILIIDDQESIRFLLGSFLKKEYRVIGFEDGFSAMQWLVNANFPDLILLDLNIPRLSGLEFLSQIKKSGFFQDIPVVIISGDDTEETMDQCNALGVYTYLTKPFDPVRLNTIVRKIFEEKASDVQEEHIPIPLLSKLSVKLKK